MTNDRLGRGSGLNAMTESMAAARSAGSLTPTIGSRPVAGRPRFLLGSTDIPSAIISVTPKISEPNQQRA